MYNNFVAAEISVSGNLDILFLLGMAIFGGTVGARVFQKLRIPQVVGYIVVGILIGQSGFHVVDSGTVRSLLPFNLFALGIIGFMIGGELKYDIFKKYGRQFIIILLAEGMFAFLIVTALTTLVAGLFTRNWINSFALGLILGAISSATAPAATVDVLWEYKTRGILTRTILAIVALDDGLALVLYGFASSIVGWLLGNGQSNLVHSILFPVWDIAGAIGLGMAAGLLLVFLLRYIRDVSKILAFSLALVLLVMGISVKLNVESILAAMVFGTAITNLLPRQSHGVFKLVEAFSPPVYVLFFVLVGARLNLSNIPIWVLVLAVAYVVGRSSGKISGSWFGARISNSPAAVRKYLGICLFNQAGVAIGLSLIAGEKLAGSFGEAVILIITTTTFLVQIIGPHLVRVGIKKAGEVGLNVTEEDLIQSYTLKDVLNEKIPTINAGTSLKEVVETVGRTESFYYPVVDGSRKLIGAITLAGIKNTFATQQLNDWLVALDIMEPVIAKLTENMPLSDALEKTRKLDVDYLPVVFSTDEDKLAGILDCRTVRRTLSAEVLSRQQKADNII